MGYKLNVSNRIRLPDIFPPEGSLELLSAVKSIIAKTTFNKKEQDILGMMQAENGSITWDKEVEKELEFDFDEKEIEIIVVFLKGLRFSGKLDFATSELYNIFVRQ